MLFTMVEDVSIYSAKVVEEFTRDISFGWV